VFNSTLPGGDHEEREHESYERCPDRVAELGDPDDRAD
jgi:hypothetical protein